MSTKHQRSVTRSQTNPTIQPSLFTSMASPATSAFSARYRAIFKTTSDEDGYLCAWLRSRLEEGLWLPREESALSCTPAQQRQLARLARLARRRGLAVWPARTSRTARQEVA